MKVRDLFVVYGETDGDLRILFCGHLLFQVFPGVLNRNSLMASRTSYKLISDKLELTAAIFKLDLYFPDVEGDFIA